MINYQQKYLKYKQKYLDLKNNIQNGGGILLTKDNTKIKKVIFKNENNNKITDKDILDLINTAYKEKYTFFIPHSDDNGECIMWKILYKEKKNKLVGFCVTTDLDQFKDYPVFESKGGIKEGKGLYITTVAGNSEYSSVVNLLFESINKYAIDNNYDYLLLQAKKYEPDNFLIRLYGKHGFKSIKEVKEEEGEGEGETETIMCKDIKEGFNCFDKINAQMK